MSVESDIRELRHQLSRPDLRGVIAVTNGPTEHDVDVTGCVENLLSNINNPMNDQLIEILKHATHWAGICRANSHSPGHVAAITEHIEDLKSAIKMLKESDMNLASCCDEAQGDIVREKQERENDHLIHALHDLSKEVIRMTGELRSALLVSSKSDLRLTGVEMKVSELTGTVNEVKATTLKVLAEIRARVDLADARIVTLEGQLADADVPEAASTALAELKTIVGQLDDITPDAPDLPPVTPPVVTPPTVP